MLLRREVGRVSSWVSFSAPVHVLLVSTHDHHPSGTRTGSSPMEPPWDGACSGSLGCTPPNVLLLEGREDAARLCRWIWAAAEAFAARLGK